MAWLQYNVGSGEVWSVCGTINFNNIQQLDLFCHSQGKWVNVPYTQAFRLEQFWYLNEKYVGLKLKDRDERLEIRLYSFLFHLLSKCPYDLFSPFLQSLSY